MDCILTLSAGRKSGLTKNKTAPLRDFIADADYCYSLITSHLRGSPADHIQGCLVCNPNEILQTFLDRRISFSRFRGRTSSGLVELAFKFSRLPTWNSHTEIIPEFVWRSASIRHMIGWGDLSFEQTMKGMRLVAEDYSEFAATSYTRKMLEEVEKYNLRKMTPSRSVIRACAIIYDAAGCLPVDDEEILKLASVFEVIAS